MTDAVWVYGVQDDAAARPPVVGCGVDPAHPIERIRLAGLAAVASRVDRERFGTDALRTALEDLDTLTTIARTHDRVLDDALHAGPVVPFRICTIYTSEHSVRAMLAREHAWLTETLERLRGRSEWGVKAYAPAPSSQGGAAAPSSGAEYLARKSAAVRDQHSLDATVVTVHERLAAAADAAMVSPPQDRRLTGHAEEMLLNGAYLVADADAATFQALVADLAARHHVPLEVTGPWPAYHFSR